MSYTKEDTIFVQIASYRDPELQWTLKDLFEKAKRPENIFVGICHQYDMKGDEDKHLFEIPFSHPEQLRIDEVDYRESQGCCWARNRVQKLWKGEKWTLMIDSHMRFEKNWDEVLVKDFKNTKQTKFIINKICSSYFQDNTTSDLLIRTILFFNEKGIVPFGFIKYYRKDEYLKDTILSCFYSGGFTFGLASLILKIKYDKFLFFHGEEVNMSVRLWTNGFNILNNNKNILYHLYKRDIKDTKNYKHLKTKNICSNFFSNPEKEKLDNISILRVKHLLNTQKSKDPEVLKDIDEYGLGKERTLRDYERFSGIDFRKKTTRQHTKEGYFEDWQEVAKIEEIKNIFINKYNS